MRSCRLQHASRSGSSLIYALLILLLIAAAVSTFLSLIALQQVALAREHRGGVARNLAEGGLHLAAAQLARTPDYRGAQGVPLGDGTFDVQVKPLSSSRWGRLRGGSPSHWEIIATGHVPVLGEAKLQRTVRARALLRRGQVHLYDWQEGPDTETATRP